MTELYKDIDGEPMISAEGMALLLGVTVDEFRAEVKRQGNDGFTPPEQWLRQGRLIAKKTKLELGGDGSMKSALDYLGKAV